MESIEEKIIESVCQYTVIYDTSHPDYMKTKLKQEIWENISKQLNLKNADEAKSIWLRLRNNHRDALRRQRRMRKSGIVVSGIKPWKYQAKMEFLLPYMVNKIFDSNFGDDNDNSELYTEQEPAESEVQYCYDEKVNILYAVELNHEDAAPAAAVNNHESDDSSVKNDPSATLALQLKKRAKKSDIENIVIKAIEEQEKRTKARIEESRQMEETKDDLYLFFMSMYEQAKKMPPVSQHAVKRNVFIAVSQEEARLLNIAEPPMLPYQQFYPGVEPDESSCHRRPDNCLNCSLSASPASNSSSNPSHSSG